MLITPSVHARHARAELETIIASLRLCELAELLERGRKLAERIAVGEDAFGDHAAVQA